MNLLVQLNGNVLADTVSPASLLSVTERGFTSTEIFTNLVGDPLVAKSFDEIKGRESLVTDPMIDRSDLSELSPIDLTMANSNPDEENQENPTEVSESSDLPISDSILAKFDNASDFQKLGRQISAFLTNTVAGENFPASPDRQREFNSIVGKPVKSGGEKSHAFAGNFRLSQEFRNIAARFDQSSVNQIQSHQLGENVGTKFSSRIGQILNSAPVHVPENHDLDQNLERVITFQPAEEPQRLGSVSVSTSNSVKPSNVSRLNIGQGGWMNELSAKIIMLQSSNDTLMLKLKPANMGMVRVEIVNQEHFQSVSLFTETDSARSMMMSAQPRLEAELRHHLQKTILIDVNFQSSSGGFDDMFKEHEQRGQRNVEYGTMDMEMSESKSLGVSLPHLSPTRLA